MGMAPDLEPGRKFGDPRELNGVEAPDLKADEAERPKDSTDAIKAKMDALNKRRQEIYGHTELFKDVLSYEIALAKIDDEIATAREKSALKQDEPTPPGGGGETEPPTIVEPQGGGGETTPGGGRDPHPPGYVDVIEGEPPKPSRESLSNARDRYATLLAQMEKTYGGVTGGVRRGIFSETKKGYVQAQAELEAARQEYLGMRSEAIGADAKKFTEELRELADVRAGKLSKDKGFGRKFYEGYRKLGAFNISNLFGKRQKELYEESMRNVRADIREKSWFNPLMYAQALRYGITKISEKALNARTAITYGLMGAAAVSGAGLAVTGGIMAMNRAASGLGMGYGSMDAVRRAGENRDAEKFTDADISKMSAEDIMTRLTRMNERAVFDGVSLGEPKEGLEGKVDATQEHFRAQYRKLEQALAEKTFQGTERQMTEAMNRTDGQMADLREKNNVNERRAKLFGTMMGLFVGGGVLGDTLHRLLGHTREAGAAAGAPAHHAAEAGAAAAGAHVEAGAQGFVMVHKGDSLSGIIERLHPTDIDAAQHAHDVVEAAGAWGKGGVPDLFLTSKAIGNFQVGEVGGKLVLESAKGVRMSVAEAVKEGFLAPGKTLAELQGHAAEAAAAVGTHAQAAVETAAKTATATHAAVETAAPVPHAAIDQAAEAAQLAQHHAEVLAQVAAHEHAAGEAMLGKNAFEHLSAADQAAFGKQLMEVRETLEQATAAAPGQREPLVDALTQQVLALQHGPFGRLLPQGWQDRLARIPAVAPFHEQAAAAVAARAQTAAETVAAAHPVAETAAAHTAAGHAASSSFFERPTAVSRVSGDKVVETQTSSGAEQAMGVTDITQRTGEDISAWTVPHLQQALETAHQQLAQAQRSLASAPFTLKADWQNLVDMNERNIRTLSQALESRNVRP